MAQFTSSPIAMLLINVVLGTVGQILLKVGMNNTSGKASAVGMTALLDAVKAISNPSVLMGFILYGISSILWLMILKKVSLSMAYPMISLSYVTVVIMSAMFLGEKPHWGTTVPGLMLIIVGVTLIGLGSGR